MSEPTWGAHPIDDHFPLGELNVYVYDGDPAPENWTCTYLVWIDNARGRTVAERHSHEIGELTFPSESAPLVVRRVRREALGEDSTGRGRAEALFGRVIVPLLDGEWVRLGQVRQGDTITQWSDRGTVPPNYVLDTEPQEGTRLSMHLLDNYGYEFPGNPLQLDAEQWVQVRRGHPATGRREHTDGH